MRITTAFLAVALVSSSSSLFGAAPAKWMEMTRQDAAMHLQLEVTEVSVPDVDSGFFYLVTVSDTMVVEGPSGSATCALRSNADSCIVP